MEMPTLKIEPKKYTGESTGVSMRMPRDMVQELDSIASMTGHTRTELMMMCLEFSLNHLVLYFFPILWYTDRATQLNNFLPDRHTFGKNVCFGCHVLLGNELCGNRSQAAFFVRGFGCALFIIQLLIALHLQQRVKKTGNVQP